MPRPALSLRAQAVAWLAQREHSERELRRKLMRRLTRPRTLAASPSIAERRAAGDSAAVPQTDQSSAAHGDAPHALEPAEAQAEVDAVITWLIARGYLDEARFVSSRVHVRQAKLGLARIQQELGQHGLSLPADTAQALRASEHERAADLWARKFGRPAADLKESAKQTRYLLSRGFASDVVRSVMRSSGRSMACDND